MLSLGMLMSCHVGTAQANDDEEEETVVVTPVKQTAGDHSWTIISQGTNHTPNQAYDKWCNIKDKEQPVCDVMSCHVILCMLRHWMSSHVMPHM
jgi:hypothetical protein